MTWRNIAYFTFTEIFSWESKVIRDCFGFASFRYVIGPENSPHVLNQSDSTLKPTRFGHLPCHDWLLIEPHNGHRINTWHFMTWSNFSQKTWYYQLRYIKYFCTQAIGLSASQDRIFPRLKLGDIWYITKVIFPIFQASCPLRYWSLPLKFNSR